MTYDLELKKTFLSFVLSKSGPLVALGITTLCVVFSSLYWSSPWGDLLAANPANVFDRGEYWRLFTTLFVHGDLKHLLSNSFMLMILSYFVVAHYGVWPYMLFSLFGGVLTNYIVLLGHAPQVSLVGISGVIYFLWGFWLILYLGIERKTPLKRRLMKAGMIYIAILIPSEFNPQVSYTAHGVGNLLGIVFGLIYFVFKRKYFRSFEEWILIVEEESPDGWPIKRKISLKGVPYYELFRKIP